MTYNSSIRLVALLSMAVVIGGATAAVSAQSGRTLSAARRIDDFNKQGDKAAIEQMRGEMSGRKPTKEELRRAAQIKAEIKQDLETLQSGYNTIVSWLKANEAEGPQIGEVVEKINRSAVRLRSNVDIPKPEQPEKIKPDVSRRDHLKRLCLQIFGFLTNPIIETPAVVEAESALRAGESLKAIIDLSEHYPSPND